MDWKLVYKSVMQLITFVLINGGGSVVHGSCNL